MLGCHDAKDVGEGALVVRIEAWVPPGVIKRFASTKSRVDAGQSLRRADGSISFMFQQGLVTKRAKSLVSPLHQLPVQPVYSLAF
jgi:hypothetical protein